MDVSHSEMQLFKRCRQRWDLTGPNRQSLSPPGAPATALWLGSVFHEGLAIAGMGMTPFKDLLDEWVEDTIEKMARNYVKVVGQPWESEELERVNDSVRDARLYLDLYIDHYVEEGQPTTTLFGEDYEVLLVEQPFKIPVPYQRGRFYTGTWDVVIRNKRFNICWIVDHKTFSQSPNPEFVNNLNEQFVGYQWAFRRLFPNDKLGGALYDGVYKGLPTVPQLKQNGQMSSRWIKTTAGMYKAELLKHGLDPDDYSEMLKKLRERDKSPENPFFKRTWIPADFGEVVGWENNMRKVIRDMASKRGLIYMNRRWEGCWDCDKSIRQICSLINSNDQAGADAVMSHWIKTEPPTQKKVRTLKPKMVTCVDDLVDQVRSGDWSKE